MSDHRHLYAIGLGSNRPHHRHGRPHGVLTAALERLEADHGLFDASPIIATPAFGFARREFANAAALIESDLAPDEMLAWLKLVEHEFGRRSGRKWGDRVLDLDILAWDGGAWRSPGLTVPHPALASRASALVPLASIAPDWQVAGPLKLKHLAARLARAYPLEPTASAR